MASPLLSLPYELRVNIYELALCTQGTVQLIGHHTRKRRRESLDSIEWDVQQRYAQKPAPHYPPGGTGILQPGVHAVEEPSHLCPEDEGAGSDRSHFEHLLIQPSDASVASEELPNTIEDYGIYLKDGVVELGMDFDSDSDSAFDDDLHDGIDGDRVFRESDLCTDSDYRSEKDDNDVEIAIDDKLLRRAPDPRISNLDRFGYNLELAKPINLALLITCREIHADATPIFYAGVNFVFDTDPTRAMRFLKTLPAFALRNITTLTLPPANLDGSYLRSAVGWAISETAWLYCTGDPPMYTPFGAFLATEMPKLTDVYAYKIMDSEPGRSCDWAFVELERLLCHGRIKRLHYLSMGEHAAQTLRSDPSSCEALGGLIDGVCIQVAYEEFDDHQEYSMPELKNPASSTGEALMERDRLERQRLDDKQMRYVRRHCELFDWEWGDRDVEMSSGTVQAVVTAWLRRRSDKRC